ncbi:hypothetical protein Btru_011130 [Bulinus truncatus]|nr:hypothetical protein Btru_011130 [Bulinus truncatus]
MQVPKLEPERETIMQQAQKTALEKKRKPSLAVESRRVNEVIKRESVAKAHIYEMLARKDSNITDDGYRSVTDNGYLSVTDDGYLSVTDDGYLSVNDDGYLGKTDDGFSGNIIKKTKKTMNIFYSFNLFLSEIKSNY